jgi:hypothetical protein
MPGGPITLRGSGLQKTPSLARCPKCREFIGSSVNVCRFCNARISPEEMQAAAADHIRLTEETSRRNNKRATRAAIGSVFFGMALLLAYFAVHGLFTVRWGDSLVDLPVPEKTLAGFTNDPKIRLGYVYDSFGNVFFNLWTWNGRYCLYKGKEFSVISSGMPGIRADNLPDKPFVYSFPPGLIVLAALGSGIATLIAIARTKGRRQGPPQPEF